ncbi:MAG: phosphate/phosphite/phosphonate ABC transporter substrate-binding protein [Elusimicrobiota bacterium]
MRTILAFFLLLSSCQAWADGNANYRIGVLANRGKEECVKRWTPTVEALTRKVPGASFSLAPLDFPEVEPAVKDGRVDFLIANSGLYVRLETLYGSQRIATLKNLAMGKGWTVFGSVIFTRQDRQDIASLADLRGKKVMAVEPDSFGGWMAAYREITDAGLKPGRDFKLEFGGRQDEPVYAVLADKAEVGIVRTDLLESMAREKKFDLAQLRVLPPPHADPRIPEDLPLLHSTRLYPEWPFIKMRGTPREVAEKVLIALLSIKPEDAAAKTGKYTGWTVPLNYQPVHDCLRAIRYSPYERYGEVSLRDTVKAYGHWLAFAAAFVLLLSWFVFRLHRLNSRLRAASAEVKTLSGLLPICAECKKIRNDGGCWEQIEHYVRARSDATFTHGICPDCTKKLYPHYSESLEKPS